MPARPSDFRTVLGLATLSSTTAPLRCAAVTPGSDRARLSPVVTRTMVEAALRMIFSVEPSATILPSRMMIIRSDSS